MAENDEKRIKIYYLTCVSIENMMRNAVQIIQDTKTLFRERVSEALKQGIHFSMEEYGKVKDDHHNNILGTHYSM